MTVKAYRTIQFSFTYTLTPSFATRAGLLQPSQILAAFAAGRTLSQIALSERVHTNTVRRTLRRYGID